MWCTQLQSVELQQGYRHVSTLAGAHVWPTACSCRASLHPIPCPPGPPRRRYPLYITPSMVETWRSEAQSTGGRGGRGLAWVMGCSVMQALEAQRCGSLPPAGFQSSRFAWHG